MADRTQPLLQHLDQFVAFARRHLHDGDLAADAVQDALTKALAKAGDLRDDDRLLAWFYRVLRNTITDLQRRRQREGQRRAVADAAEAPAPPDEATACACLRPAVRALPAAQAGILEAVDLDGRPIAEVAAELGITENTLNVRRHRARKALYEQMRSTCRVCATHGCVDCDCGR